MLLKQWPFPWIHKETRQQLVPFRGKPDHDPLMQNTPVFWLCDHPTTGCNHERMALANGLQHLAFKGSEPLLSVGLKDLGNGAASQRFHDSIGVNEAIAQSLG
jgi:hypothetical protein